MRNNINFLLPVERALCKMLLIAIKTVAFAKYHIAFFCFASIKKNMANTSYYCNYNVLGGKHAKGFYTNAVH